MLFIKGHCVFKDKIDVINERLDGSILLVFDSRLYSNKLGMQNNQVIGSLRRYR